VRRNINAARTEPRVEGKAIMADGVVVLLAVFSCAADLLTCAPQTAPQHVFADMPACRQAAAAIAPAAPSAAAAEGGILTARCRYDVERNAPTPAPSVLSRSTPTAEPAPLQAAMRAR